MNENVRKDGERIICEWHNRIVTDDSDNVVAIFSQFQDITERRTQRKELERHREVIESASNTIITIDESNVVQSVNPAVEETFGYSPAELTGEPLTKLMSDAVAERHRSGFEEYLRSGEKTLDWGYTEFEAQHRDGSPIPVGVTFGEVAYEEERWFVGILRDISGERAQKQELEWTNAVFSTLLDTLPVGIIAESEDREVLAVNDRMLELFDFPGSPAETVGSDCEEIAEAVSEQFEDPEAFVDRINEIVTADIAVHEETLDLANGRTFVRTHEPIELPDGKGHLWTYRDITEQRAYESRLAALSEMAQELIQAESRQEIAEIGVEAARDVLGLEANAIHLVDDDRSALVPVAGTDSLFDLIGEPPTFTADDSIAWRVFEDNDALAVDDTHDDPDIYNPDSPLRSELHLPLGSTGSPSPPPRPPTRSTRKTSYWARSWPAAS
nr:PAS domain S-box protein [Halolamina pelagica]